MANNHFSILRFIARAALCLLAISSVVPTHAAVVIYGGYTWDQSNDPNNGLQLGVNDDDIRSGAKFGPGDNNNLPRTGNITLFIEAQPGASTSIGYVSRITQRKTSEAPAKLETTGTRAVNLPSAADVGGAEIRRGIQVSWNPGTKGFTNPVMVNSAGDDFVIWESGNAGQPDALMARVRNAVSRQYTDWYYFSAQTSPVSSGGVLFAYAYDLSDFGLGVNAQIDRIEMANMNSYDRIAATGAPNGVHGYAAEGRVVSYPTPGPPPPPFGPNSPGPDPGPLASSAYNGIPYGGGTYDPDPLYVAVLGNLHEFVPEPASCFTWASIIGLVALGDRRRRT
jgi:hypothetical protein